MNQYLVVGIVFLVVIALLATNKKLVETLKNIYKIEELRKLSDRGKTPSEPKRCCSGSGAEHRTEPSPSGGAHRILRASGMESNV